MNVTMRRLHFPTLVLTKSGSKGQRKTPYLSYKSTPSGLHYEIDFNINLNKI